MQEPAQPHSIVFKFVSDVQHWSTKPNSRWYLKNGYPQTEKNQPEPEDQRIDNESQKLLLSSSTLHIRSHSKIYLKSVVKFLAVPLVNAWFSPVDLQTLASSGKALWLSFWPGPLSTTAQYV